MLEQDYDDGSESPESQSEIQSSPPRSIRGQMVQPRRKPTQDAVEDSRNRQTGIIEWTKMRWDSPDIWATKLSYSDNFRRKIGQNCIMLFDLVEEGRRKIIHGQVLENRNKFRLYSVKIDDGYLSHHRLLNAAQTTEEFFCEALKGQWDKLKLNKITDKCVSIRIPLIKKFEIKLVELEQSSIGEEYQRLLNLVKVRQSENERYKDQLKELNELIFFMTEQLKQLRMERMHRIEDDFKMQSQRQRQSRQGSVRSYFNLSSYYQASQSDTVNENKVKYRMVEQDRYNPFSSYYEVNGQGSTIKLIKETGNWVNYNDINIMKARTRSGTYHFKFKNSTGSKQVVYGVFSEHNKDQTDAYKMNDSVSLCLEDEIIRCEGVKRTLPQKITVYPFCVIEMIIDYKLGLVRFLISGKKVDQIVMSTRMRDRDLCAFVALKKLNDQIDFVK